MSRFDEFVVSRMFYSNDIVGTLVLKAVNMKTICYDSCRQLDVMRGNQIFFTAHFTKLKKFVFNNFTHHASKCSRHRITFIVQSSAFDVFIVFIVLYIIVH